MTSSTDLSGLLTSLYQEIRETALLNSCAGILGWDERTYMPKNAAYYRGEQIGLLARLSHEKFTSPQIGEKLNKIEALFKEMNATDISLFDKANVREISRAYLRAVKLPGSFVAELAKTTSEAQGAWQQARAENRFEGFEPWLTKIVKMKREEAQLIGYNEHPYNALLDEYEPGATVSSIRSLFAELRQELVPFLQNIVQSKRKPNTEILTRNYPVQQQELFGKQAAEKIGFDFNSGRLDVTTHPFCSGITPGDCRITTRYNPKFFNEAFFGILHEAGHGIYEQNLPSDHFGLPAGSAISLGIHESQSRLWENQIGRSLPFWQYFFPLAQTAFPEALGDVSLTDWLFAINEVKPSLIRVEADEVTYNLHIILRFELEVAILGQELNVKDIPGIWNEKMKEFFGLTPPSNQLGCLQDIHWSMGGLGYFPTYTLGNLFAAQFMNQFKLENITCEQQWQQGDFASLKKWLVDKIHRFGQQYRSSELCQQITGKDLSHKPFMQYLREKFSKLYDL